MRKLAVVSTLLILLILLAVVVWPRPATQPTPLMTTVHAAGESRAALPAIFAPEATPTPRPLPTATATPTVSPTPVASPSPTAEPLPGNALVNGSFEDDWTNLPPAPGFLINQEPAGWTLKWLDVGQPIWDDPGTTAQGIPESVHKRADLLPDDEQPGGSRPLILDGIWTYKMFHFGAPFGSQLRQVVAGLPPGSQWRFVVPIQLHNHGDPDPWGAESSAWAVTSATQSGGWVPAGDMGDRKWFYHNVEFTVPADGRVELLIRVKSKWFRAKDFFIDDVQLQPLGNVRLAAHRFPPHIDGDSVTWGPRALECIPAREIVVP
jgi:hypothetical protein